MQQIVNSNSNLNFSVFKIPENCLIPTLNDFMLAKDLKPNTLLPTNDLPVKVENVALSNHLEMAYTHSTIQIAAIFKLLNQILRRFALCK